VSGASRRAVLWSASVAVGAAVLRAASAQSPGGAQMPRTIQMVARRFVYEPDEIRLKAGEKVVVEIRSIDFVHGMNIPALGKRFDLVPGKMTRVELQPDAPGVIDFVCDNFCGDGHEQMHGRFVIS
jgi:cytochrome c oxidase subunit 2